MTRAATSRWPRIARPTARGLHPGGSCHGLTPASHPDTITRTTEILGPGPVQWAVELGHLMSRTIIQEIPALGAGDNAFEILRPGPESAVLQSLAADSP